MTDTERLDWLEQNQGAALVSDDDCHWAVSVTGVQNIPYNTPADIQTSFLVKKHEWHPTIRAAIDAAIAEENESA
jgi:hypothetical protein